MTTPLSITMFLYLRKREAGTVVFSPDHVLVVQGYPKELGTGEVQVLYTVLVPKSVGTKTGTFVTTKSLVSGVESGTSIIRNQLSSTVTSAKKYAQIGSSPPPEKNDSQIAIIGAGAGGGTLVLIVLIVTIGCCYVKRLVVSFSFSILF